MSEPVRVGIHKCRDWGPPGEVVFLEELDPEYRRKVEKYDDVMRTQEQALRTIQRLQARRDFLERQNKLYSDALTQVEALCAKRFLNTEAAMVALLQDIIGTCRVVKEAKPGRPN